MAGSGREQREIDPRQREVSRRRFLRNAGALAVGVPVLGAVLEACGGGTSSGQGGSTVASGSFGANGKDPYPSHPNYHFALVNHVTTNSFFTPTRYGAQDACNLLGCSYSWTGSQNSIVSEMVNAMNSAIASKVDGIGVPVIDPKAFTAPTEKALSQGIPVVAYNAPPPTGSDTPTMAYIGQEIFQAGVEAGKRILQVVKPGDLVAGIIATPGTGNIQPRIDGAWSVLKPAGVHVVEVGTGATQGPEIPHVEAWYQGHQDVKFLYAVDSGDGIAVATTIAKYNLAAKGIKGSGWDVGTPTLQQVAKGTLDFTIDQQAYLQGFLPILYLFLYQISGGLLRPSDTDTGLLFVTKDNVGPYVSKQDRYEGSSSTEKILTAPSSIKV